MITPTNESKKSELLLQGVDPSDSVSNYANESNSYKQHLYAKLCQKAKSLRKLAAPVPIKVVALPPGSGSGTAILCYYAEGLPQCSGTDVGAVMSCAFEAVYPKDSNGQGWIQSSLWVDTDYIHATASYMKWTWVGPGDYAYQTLPDPSHQDESFIFKRYFTGPVLEGGWLLR